MAPRHHFAQGERSGRLSRAAAGCPSLLRHSAPYAQISCVVLRKLLQTWYRSAVSSQSAQSYHILRDVFEQLRRSTARLDSPIQHAALSFVRQRSAWLIHVHFDGWAGLHRPADVVVEQRGAVPYLAVLVRQRGMEHRGHSIHGRAEQAVAAVETWGGRSTVFTRHSPKMLRIGASQSPDR